MADTFSVKNFERFQHYKDRSPPWIKFYNDVLDDYEFGRLPDASKAHLVAIWLLASRYNNVIPHDAEWVARRINATSPVDLEGLARSGFIIAKQACSKTLADCKQDACPETETETEVEKTPPKPPKGGGVDLLFNRFWAVYPRRGDSNPRKPAFDKFRTACKRGVDPEAIIAGAKAYAHQCQVLGKVGTSSVAQAVTWLNQERWADDHSVASGHGPPRHHNGMDRTMNVIREMHEEANALQGDETLSAGKLVQLIPPARARGN
jgi:hypothetical protein